MAKTQKVEAAVVQTTELEQLAVALEALAVQADQLGEEAVAKSIRNSVKSCRWNDKLRANRLKRVGSLITSLQAKGLTADQIVARLSK